MTTDPALLRQYAEDIGAYLLSCYVVTKADLGIEMQPGDTESKDMCRASAYATAQILRELTGQRWRVEAGWEYQPKYEEDYHKFRMDQFPGGMLDSSGAWKGHYWAASVPVDGEPQLIVDLTADQFGHEDVIVTDSTDPRYRSNILPQTVDDELGHGSRIYGNKWAWDFILSYEPCKAIRRAEWVEMDFNPG